YDLSLTAGTDFADGRGSVIGYVGYYDRAQLNQPDRPFSRAPLFYVGPGNGIVGPQHAWVGFGSSATEEGQVPNLGGSQAAMDTVFGRYGYAAGTVEPMGIGFNSDSTLFTMGNFSPDSVVNFRGVGDPLTSSSSAHSYNTANFWAL